MTMRTQTSFNVNSLVESKLTGTILDIDEVKAFYEMPPSLRDTAFNTLDYMQKASMDDILKDLYDYIKGHHVDPIFTISCIRRNPEKIFSSGFLCKYINWCLARISDRIEEKELYTFIPKLEEIRYELQPILEELADEAGCTYIVE